MARRLQKTHPRKFRRSTGEYLQMWDDLFGFAHPDENECETEVVFVIQWCDCEGKMHCEEIIEPAPYKRREVHVPEDCREDTSFKNPNGLNNNIIYLASEYPKQNPTPSRVFTLNDYERKNKIQFMRSPSKCPEGIVIYTDHATSVGDRFKTRGEKVSQYWVVKSIGMNHKGYWQSVVARIDHCPLTKKDTKKFCKPNTLCKDGYFTQGIIKCVPCNS